VSRYTPKIAKTNLEHGAYYSGRCRNATQARWNANIQRFVYWRTKFDHKFLEQICHPEDEKHFDVFVVEERIDQPIEEIPLHDHIKE
jgi:hypothetical protein